ncbi:hypothetical protein DBR40_21480 [Pedobacter sp. KBW01]|nr:hypothetical protein DBR40_21480 [Pedobacter sp. KBW01]
MPLYDIGEIIMAKTGRDFLLEGNLVAIAGRALHGIGFELSTDKAVVAKNCRLLMEKKVAVHRSSDENVIAIFCEQVLRVVEPPKAIYDGLIRQATADLAMVGDVLRDYEREPFIQELNAGKRENGRAHSEYTMDLFYKRAREKAREIREYIAHGAKEIAITRSGRYYVEQVKKGIIYPQMEKQLQYPYMDGIVRFGKLEFEVDLERIDHKKINPYKNKMFVFDFTGDIRTASHQVLDREILERLDHMKVIAEVLKEIAKIPLLNKRTEIFKQLAEMAGRELWYGFYALALPQVEGIVVELLEIAGNNRKDLKALPQKAGVLRTVASNGDFDMDYYQFYLPEKRNKFSHSGKDMDIKTKSFHMILDLKHLLHTAAGLQTNLIFLNNMANEGSLGINHIGDLVKMIRLMKQEEGHAHYKEVKGKLELLVYLDLINRYDLVYLVRELSGLLLIKLKEFDKALELGAYLEKSGPLAFSTLSNAETASKIDLILKAIERTPFSEAHKFIMDIYIFAMKFPRVFADLPDEVKGAFRELPVRHSRVWPKLGMLSKVYKPDIIEDYLMGKKEMMTLLGNAKK